MSATLKLDVVGRLNFSCLEWWWLGLMLSKAYRMPRLKVAQVPFERSSAFKRDCHSAIFWLLC